MKGVEMGRHLPQMFHTGSANAVDPDDPTLSATNMHLYSTFLGTEESSWLPLAFPY